MGREGAYARTHPPPSHPPTSAPPFTRAEAIAECASTALGGVAAGALGTYLPLLLQHARAQAGAPRQLYQLLKARERESVCVHVCVEGAAG